MIGGEVDVEDDVFQIQFLEDLVGWADSFLSQRGIRTECLQEAREMGLDEREAFSGVSISEVEYSICRNNSSFTSKRYIRRRLLSRPMYMPRPSAAHSGVVGDLPQ